MAATLIPSKNTTPKVPEIVPHLFPSLLTAGAAIRQPAGRALLGGVRGHAIRGLARGSTFCVMLAGVILLAPGGFRSH